LRLAWRLISGRPKIRTASGFRSNSSPATTQYWVGEYHAKSLAKQAGDDRERQESRCEGQGGAEQRPACCRSVIGASAAAASGSSKPDEIRAAAPAVAAKNHYAAD
jgi:hypothetical protein